MGFSILIDLIFKKQNKWLGIFILAILFFYVLSYTSVSPHIDSNLHSTGNNPEERAVVHDSIHSDAVAPSNAETASKPHRRQDTKENVPKKTGITLAMLEEFLNTKINPENEIIIGKKGEISLYEGMETFHIGAISSMASVDPIVTKVGIDLLMAKYKETDITLFPENFMEELKEISATEEYGSLLKLLSDSSHDALFGQYTDQSTYSFIISELWNSDELGSEEFKAALKKAIRQ